VGRDASAIRDRAIEYHYNLRTSALTYYDTCNRVFGKTVACTQYLPPTETASKWKRSCVRYYFRFWAVKTAPRLAKPRHARPSKPCHQSDQ